MNIFLLFFTTITERYVRRLVFVDLPALRRSVKRLQTTGRAERANNKIDGVQRLLRRRRDDGDGQAGRQMCRTVSVFIKMYDGKVAIFAYVPLETIR